jgi:hypothetical protein
MDNREIQNLKLYINKILSKFFKGERYDFFNSNKNVIQNVLGRYIRHKYGDIDYTYINTFTDEDTKQIVKQLNNYYNDNEAYIIKQTTPGLFIHTPEDDEEGIKMTVVRRKGGKRSRKHKISRKRNINSKRKRSRKTRVKMRK